MKLFYSPFHGFIHKALVATHVCGHWESMEFVPTFPFRNRDGEDQGDAYSIAAINPLDKVPTLVTDDGTVIYGSEPLCRYLDHVSVADRLYPDPGPALWDALRRHDRAQTVFEGTVQMNMEGWYPEAERHMGLYRWLWPKILRAFDEMEAEAGDWGDALDIGHACTLHALSYLDFGSKFYEAVDPLYPRYDFRENRPRLAAWYERITRDPAVTSHWNIDYQGDDSAEHCQRHVREVLALQGRAA